MSTTLPPTEFPFEDERVTAYLDDELSPAERAAFEADLAVDAALRAELDALTNAQTFLHDHGSLAAPPDLLDAILAAAAEEKVVSIAWYRRPFGIPLEGLAVAAAALLVVYVALPSRPTPVTTPTDIAAGRAAPVQKAAETEAATTTALSAANDKDQEALAAAELDAKQQALAEKRAWDQKASTKLDKAAVSKERSEGVDDFQLPGKNTSSKGTSDKTLEDLPATDPLGGAKPLFSQVPYSYTIATEDPAVLAQLAALAARYNGQLKGDGAEALAIEELTGTDAATVLVKIPSHALRDFGRSLGALGVVRAQSDNSMFAGDPVEVRVSVQLVKAAGTGSVLKNATPDVSVESLQ